MPADRLAVGHAFVGEGSGGGEREGLLLGHRGARAHRAANLLHGVHGVHGGGSGFADGAVDGLDVEGEALGVAAAKGARALGQPIRGRGGDRGGAPHDHVANGERRWRGSRG